MTRALVTGATGYVGARLVPRLLREGYAVRVLTRDPSRIQDREWAAAVEVVTGDARSGADLQAALREVDTAFYLIHSMDGEGDFAARDRDLAFAFGRAANACGLSRIVYLSGLHPSGRLSPHLASRVEVGEILMSSGVPTSVVQAAVILGAGSASFEMLRHLTVRLPAMITPKWLDNRIQPIAIADVLDHLLAAAKVAPDANRTYDIGGPDVLTYREMIQRYAAVAGMRPRAILTVPVLTPHLASLWVGLVTPVPTGVAKPLVGSLVHEVVCTESDLTRSLGTTPSALISYDEAVRRALSGHGGSALPEPGAADPALLTAADPAWAGEGGLLSALPLPDPVRRVLERSSRPGDGSP